MVTIPLMVLAAGALLVGWLNVPQIMGGHLSFDHYLAPSVDPSWSPEPAEPEPEHSLAVPLILTIISVAVGLGGIWLGWFIYIKKKGRPAEEYADKHRDLHQLLMEKYLIDEGYEKIIIRPLLYINEKSGQFDNEVVDGIVNGTAKVTSGTAHSVGYFDNEVVDAAINASAHVTQSAGQRVRRLQTGRIRDYVAFAVVGGLVVIGLFCLYGSDALTSFFGGQ